MVPRRRDLRWRGSALYLNGLLVAQTNYSAGIFAGTAGVGLGAVPYVGPAPYSAPYLMSRWYYHVRLPGRNFALQSSSF